MANPFAEFAPKEEAKNPFLEFAPQKEEVNPFLQFAPKPEPKPEEQSALRQVADVPLQLGQGAVKGIRMVADAFGAGSDVSNALRDAEDYIGDLFSAQSKQDAKEVARIMKEAEDKGVLDQVKAGLKAITVAPVDLVVNALGTSALPLATLLLGGGTAATARLIGAGVGAIMGAGTVKGTIYDAVKDELKKTEMTPEQIEERAQLAQAYGGKNLDMILGGVALGGVGAASGFERGAAKLLADRILKKQGATEAAELAAEAAAKEELRKVAKRGAIGQGTRTGAVEFGTEALQGSQEQLAENIALRREGYDVPLMRGVIAQGVLEGVAGLGLGAPTGALEGRAARKTLAAEAERQLTDEQIKALEVPLTDKEKPKDVALDEAYVKQVATDLVMAGVTPESAREMAIQIATEEARADAIAEADAKGAEDAAKPDAEPSGVSPEVAGQPSAMPAAGGVGAPEPDGMVSAGQPTPDLVEGEAAAPAAIAEAPSVEAAAPTTEAPSVETPAVEVPEIEQAAAPEAVPTPAPAPQPVVVREGTMAAADVKEKLRGKSTTEVAEQVEPVRLEPGELVSEEAPPALTEAPTEVLTATPTEAKVPAKRGPKGARLTPEQKAASAAATKEQTKVWKSVNGLINKAVEKFNESQTELDPENYPDIGQFQEAVESQRISKIQAIKSLLELQKLARGKPKLETAIKEALANPAITPKELADVKAGLQRASKATKEVKVGRADTRFNNFTNAEQALRHVIKTGNPFQRFLANRLLPFVRDVTFTVIEEGEALPDVIVNGGAQEDWDMSRGLFLREVASGQRHIFVRGLSGGPSQGVNNVTVLHEALHAALNKKMDMADWALRTGYDRDSSLAKAFGTLQETIRLTQERMADMQDAGTLPESMYELVDSGIFSDAREFVAYAMTDPVFQKFLMETPGVVKESLFTRFVNAVREFFGMAPDTVNALSDVINITDKMLTARMTPLMRMEVQAEREASSDAEVSSMAKKNVAKTNKQLDKLALSNKATGPQISMLGAIEELVKTRDGTILTDVLQANKDSWKSGTLRQLLPMLQTETVVEWANKLGLNRLVEAWNSVKDMNAMRVQATAKAAPISDKLVKLAANNIQQYTSLANAMHYSTLAKIDPSKDTKSKAMNELWSKLDDDTKKLYDEVRDYYASNYDTYHELLLDQIAASKIPGTANDPKTAKGKLMAEIKKMYETGAEEVTAADGTKYRPPYFPLVRYGQYWLRVGKGKTREFYMFESQTEREVFLRQRVRDMQKAGDTRTYEEMYKDMDVQKGDNIQDARNNIKDTSALIKSIFEAIEDAAGRPISVTDEYGNQVSKYSTIDPEKMKDEVYQLYLHTLPERNFRRQFIHRKGTTGFSQDIARNFANTSTNMANQLARIKYAPQMLDQVQAAKDALAGNPDEARLGEFVTEMRIRIEREAYPDPQSSLGHQMAEFANKSAFLWMMSTVKTAVAQFSAIPVFAAPVLASKHGHINTARELGRFLNIFNNFGVMREDADGSRSFVGPTVATSRNVKLNAEEQRAAQYMIDRGISETTLAYDLGSRRKVPTHVQQSPVRRTMKAVTDVMTGLFHHSERMIREVTFMAAFRLYRDKNPNMSFEEVARLAESDVYTALGNFASVNRPRGVGATAERQVLLDAHKPLGRAVLQFKMFPAFVTTYFVRNAYRMTRDLDPQARKEARIQFFGSLMTSLTLAGYMGVPGISFAMGIAQGLRNLFRDEDDEDPIEERDLEFWFRNVWLPQTFGNVKIGDRNLAELMDRGVVAALTGYDISSSLSLNNMWFPEMKEQATAEATVLDYLRSLGGPFVSLTTSQLPKAVDYFNQGKILQGVEQLLPGMMRAPVTAYRYSQEGATTASGAIIKEPDEYTLGQLFAQAGGFATEGLVAKREAIFKANALMLQVKNEKKQLLNRLDVDIRSDKDLDDVMDDVSRFNYKNPFDPITGDTLRASIKQHLQRRVMTDRGFYMDKRYYPVLMDLLEPSTERLEKEAQK